MKKSILLVAGIIGYGIASTAGIVSSAPIDSLVNLVSKILVG